MADGMYSAQDLEDLKAIRSRLPKDDPRGAKIDQLLSSSQPNAGLAPPSSPNIQMKESLAPKMVRGAASSLPVIGGMGGAIAGAPAFGAGGVVGGALGAAGGEAANLAIQKGIFGDDVGSTGDQLKDVAGAGALGAVSEIPGALATSAGNRVLSNIAKSVPRAQSGEAAHGLMDASPMTFNPQGLVRSIKSKFSEVSEGLGKVLNNSTGTAPVDAIVDNSRLQLEHLAMNSPDPALQKVAMRSLRKFDEVIGAAKHNVGITGQDATAQQLFSLQKELQKPGWVGNPGPVAEVLRNTFRDTYGDLGQSMRTLAPEADEYLTRLTNLHAAEAAIKAYKPGRTATLALSAGLNPRKVAALSPFAAGAGVAGSEKIKQVVGNLAGELAP